MILFIRHAEPIKTDEWHGKWNINPEDCKDIKFNISFDHYLCSALNRSIQTGKAIYPDADFQQSCLLNEIEKGVEEQSIFEERVKRALSEVILPLKGNVFVSSHARFMRVAHNLLLGFDRKFQFLEHFEVKND